MRRQYSSLLRSLWRRGSLAALASLSVPTLLQAQPCLGPDDGMHRTRDLLDVGWVEGKVVGDRLVVLTQEGFDGTVNNWDWGVRLYDVTEPELPALVGSRDLPAWGEHDSGYSNLTVDGMYAYVIRNEIDFGCAGEIHVIRLDDSETLPGWMEPLPGTLAWANGIHADDGRVHAVTSEDCANLRLDILEQGAGELNLLGSVVLNVDLDWWLPTSLDVENGVAYLAPLRGPLVTVSITDPAFPAVLGEFPLPEGRKELLVRGDVAYVLQVGGPLVLFDVSVPAAPVPLSSPGISGEKMVIAGGRMYLDADGNVDVFDLADPTAPNYVGTLDRSASSSGMEVSADCAYFGVQPVNFGRPGVQVTDIVPSVVLTPLVQQPLDSDAVDLAVRGQKSYVATEGDGIVTIDLSDPASPVVLPGAEAGSYSALASTEELLVAARTETLQVFSFGSAGQLVPRGTLGFGDPLVEVDVVGQVSAVAAADQVFLVDLSDPEHPYVLSALASSTAPLSMSGSLLAVKWSEQLRIFDVAEPTTPELLHTLPYPGTAPVLLDGDRLALRDPWNDMVSMTTVLSLEDPDGPVTGPGFINGAPHCGFAFDGDLLYTYQDPTYASDGIGFVHAFDLAAPMGPRGILSIQTEGPHRAADVFEGHLVLAASERGIEIMPTPCREPSSAGPSPSQIQEIGRISPSLHVLPNPGSGTQLRVTWDLPLTRPRVLEIVDVRGRRWGGLEVPVGRVEVRWQPEAGRELPAGVYWVKWRSSGEAGRSFVVVR